jgi:hypothetical protein
MNLDKLIELTKSKVITKSDNINEFDIEYAGASDLMSDFLAFSKENMFLITGLTSPQTITTAAVIGAKGIIFVRGKEIKEDIIKIAKDLDITILKSNLSMYVACAVLYNNGLRDSMETDEALK